MAVRHFGFSCSGNFDDQWTPGVQYASFAKFHQDWLSHYGDIAIHQDWLSHYGDIMIYRFIQNGCCPPSSEANAEGFKMAMWCLR